MLSPRARKFLSYYRPYRRIFFTVMLGAALVASITLVQPLIVRHITRDLLASPSAATPAQIARMGALMVALLVIQTAVQYYVDYRGHAMGAMMERDIRAELFAHLQKLPFRFYDHQRTGQLMSRLSNDLLSLAELYHHGPEDYLFYSVKFIGAFVILAGIDFRLTLVVFLFLPLLAGFSLYFTGRMRAVFKASRARIGDVNAQAEDNLAGIRVVKSFASEAAEIGKFTAENDRFLESRKAIYRGEAVIWNGVGFITQMITVALVVFGGINIARASLDLPDLITFLLYISALVEPVNALTHMTEQLQEGISGFERFIEIIEQPPETSDDPGATEIGRARGEVAFLNVGFRYDEDRPHVLKGISLRALPGDSIALVGSSGVGKTTLCALIPRFYEVSEGEIRLDGINIKEIRLDSLRRNIGVVQQDVYLFAGTVRENIRYGHPDASDAQIVAAARKANAHDFILALPQGYDTDIGQRGVRLSGGQKQRLSIARAFLKDPPVLIFDEATSSLDSESEKVVQESLDALAKDRTTFIIAHRLSTVRRASRILVLSDKGIDEQGTHEELLARNGLYARFYGMQ